MASSPLRIGVLAYPGCFGSEVFGIVDLLTMAGHVARARNADRTAPFEVSVVSPRRRVIASGGVQLGVGPLRDVDVLVVPGFELAPDLDLDQLLGGLRPEIDAIRAHRHSGGALVSICVGAFLIGAAGELDGRKVTTSWLFADALARRFPDAEVSAEDLVVTDAGVTTTAAFSAMYEFALDLVRRHCGPAVARRTARICLLSDARVSQAPYVDADLLPATGADFAARVRRYLDQHQQDRYDLTRLAEHLHVSTRTLLRRYKQETGESPLVHLQRSRMQKAKHLLETTDRPTKEIHRAVGYQDPGAFAALFARHHGIGPGDYRAKFRRQRSA